MDATGTLKTVTAIKSVSLFICLFPIITNCQIAKNGVGEFYSAELVRKYGGSSKIDSIQLEELVTTVHRLSRNLGRKPSLHGYSGGVPLAQVSLNAFSTGNCSGYTNITCLKTKCLNAATILSLYGLQPNEGATGPEMTQLSSSVLFQLQNPECYKGVQLNSSEDTRKDKKPTPTEVWGYGFLSVTIINVAACLGIMFYPIMKTNVYRRILMCMVGLAVGTLSASAILVLIPETFELMADESHVKEIYIWRGLVVVGGIYLFFTIERLLDSIMMCQRKSAIKKKNKKNKNADPVEGKSYTNAAFDGEHEISVIEGERKIANGHGHSHGEVVPAEDQPKAVVWAPMSSIKSVAWMIIFGDAVHNFVDGLSIGAAFSENTLAGVSLSLAVFCEELPHELGDFAVLLASGMGVCQAILMNFLSALTCYVGLVIGIQVGALEQGALWIFALAGGMFLYISLVDMLPEMNDQARQEEERGGSKCMVYLLQNFGLLLGWTIILIISLYGGEIKLG